MSKIKQCKKLTFKKFKDSRGKILIFDDRLFNKKKFKRIYFLTDFNKKIRGEHAHKNLHQLFIAISGKIEIEVDDGTRKKLFTLQSNEDILYTPNMLWRRIKSNSKNAILMVIASDYYNQKDYLRDYNNFKKIVND